MKPERVQEIRERYVQEDGLYLYSEIAVKDILELVAALENAQTELANLRNEVKYYKDVLRSRGATK